MAEQFNRQNADNMPSESEQIAIRKEKLAAMREEGRDPFLTTTYDIKDYAKDIKENFRDDSEEQMTVSVAGRVMTRRIMGKASFFNLQDTTGTIQVYARRDDVG